jgi:uncharacterized protein (TIGR00251 family)
MKGLIAVHVVPRASRTEVRGIHGDAIRIRVAAAPVEGAANDEELIKFIAQALRVQRGAVRIVAGQSSRHKRVEVTGLDSETILKRLLTPEG